MGLQGARDLEVLACVGRGEDGHGHLKLGLGGGGCQQKYLIS